MFTGIIEEVGKVSAITENSIEVNASVVLSDAKIGDSIAVNGVCLTVRKINSGGFVADVSNETYKVTSLGKLNIGNLVNLERALPANGRLGGHIVSGHVDGCGKIVNIRNNKDFYDLYVELSNDLCHQTVKKGSISINGISLTIADIEGNVVKIAVIPHTFKNTNLKEAKTYDYVNIETDILSKYVEKFLSTRDNKTVIDEDFLQANGF